MISLSVFIRNWTSGKTKALDITATNALQAATVAGCAEDGAYAVKEVVSRKQRKYAASCEAEGLIYVPVAIDTFGSWHSLALETIGRLSQELARATDGELGVVCRHLRQQLAICFLQDNVAMLGARRPTFASPEVDGAEC